MNHNFPDRGIYFRRCREERNLVRRLAEVVITRPRINRSERRLLRLLLSRVIPRLKVVLKHYCDQVLLKAVHDSLVDVYNVNMILRNPDRDVKSKLKHFDYSRIFTTNQV